MTNRSIADNPNSPQDLALQLKLSAHVHRIAEELYRFDRRDETARLDELSPAFQQTYLQSATAAAFLSDQERLRPAIYDAADQLVPGGIGNLTRPRRAMVVKTFIRAWQVMREHLNGKRHPETSELMRVLSHQDASIAHHAPAAPVTDATVNLADLTTTGVQ